MKSALEIPDVSRHPESSDVIFVAQKSKFVHVDIDEKSCEVVMRRYNLSTKKEAVNMALRLLAREAMSIDEARKLRGTGWDEDLESLRSNRFS